VEPRIDSDYIKTGKISYTYKYFPVIDQGKIGESHWAAYGAECANEQGRFWEFQDKLFAEWRGENAGVFTRDNLKKFAADIKLDIQKFNACLDSDRYAPLVLEHLTEALQLRLPGTPFFLLNGRRMDTPTLVYDEFWKQIEEELKTR
jgi:protein-disulfide isomerase